MMKNILASVGLLAVLGCIYLAFSSSSDSITSVHSKLGINTTASQNIQQVHIPEAITFAGEAVPLEEEDARERLDRELTNITFRHSSTVRILKLANRWFPILEPILQRNGIPDDFKYLAVAESSLENVVSPAGAKGFWQFMSATAKSYNMEVSDDVEERYNIEKSTEAACKYLQEARRKFNGWTTAAASYNRGMAGMNGHIEDQQTSDYYDLYLNEETARYIYRIVAYKQLMTNPSVYGFNLTPEDMYPPYEYTTVNIESIPDIATFAKNFGTNYKGIKMLNPWLQKTFLRAKSGKTYDIKIPKK
ncbi:MAG: lytic transglycosylase domain-containing protein [Chitinophagales bacterium]